MANDVTGKNLTGVAKPLPSQLGEEMGILASFPVTSFDSFSYGLKHEGRGGAFLYNRDPNSVPVEKLVEMRRRDYQTRALLRMFILPILACVEDGEWIMGENYSGKGGGEKEVEFANNMFRVPPHAGGMTVSLHLMMRQFLLALVEGFSAFEEVYYIPKVGPLKGKITLRKLAHRDASTIRFAVDDKGGFNGLVQKAKGPDGMDVEVHIPKEKSLFYTCFTGDTEVALLDGTSVPIAEVVERVQRGEEMWTYSVRDGEIVPGKITEGQEMGVRDLVAVALDNGEVVRCTPEHLWMLRDGTYKAAGDLQPGDSLMPLYRRSAGLGRAQKQYEQVYQPRRGAWLFTHRVVSDYFEGPCQTGWLTHHRDVNAFNNDPRNLQRVTFEQHRAIHDAISEACSEAMRAKWSDEQWRANQMAVLQSEAYREKQRAAHTPERRAATAERMRSWMLENAPHARRDITVEAILAAAQRFYGLRETADFLGVHEDTVINRLRETGAAQTWAEFLNVYGVPAPRRGSASGNLFLDLIEEFEEAARSQPGEWVQVADGVTERQQLTIHGWVRRNPSYGMKVKFRRGVMFIAATAEKAAEYINHKVVSVERLSAPEAVYDITVAEHHNFALSAGVFVHNCQREENPFYGVSLFEAAWYSYDVKAKLYYVAHVAAQLAAVPGRIGTYPASASVPEKAAFRKMLADFAFNSSAALPPGFEVKPFASTSGFNFIELINHHSASQAKSVLLQFVDSDRRLAVIENGGADASADFFVQALESIMGEISEILSVHLMPKFIDWNFGSGNYPVWRFGKLSDSSRDTIKEVFQSIVTSSVLNCTPEFMRETEEKLAQRLGYDIDYKEIREREEEAAEKQAELAELEAQITQQQGAPPGQEGVPPGEEEEGGTDFAPPAAPQPDFGAPATAALSGAYPSLQNDLDSLVSMAQQMLTANPMVLPDGVPDPEFDGR